MLFDLSTSYDRSDLAFMLDPEADLPALSAKGFSQVVADIAFEIPESDGSMTYNTGGWATLPIILPGQVYLNAELQEYLVVTGTKNGRARYRGPGFGGLMDSEDFIQIFGPVDVSDLWPDEHAELEAFVPGVELKTGFIGGESYLETEADEDEPATEPDPERVARTSKPCTVDGVQIYESRNALVAVLGRGTKGLGSPTFRYV